MGRRIALVVGVSEYKDFPPLPNSARDADTLAEVLRSTAGFDDVQILLNPDHSRLGEKVEEHFTDKAPDDLVLFYFSGHGVKDESGKLHLATPSTRKHAGGELVRASAVSCQHIHETMANSRSRRLVVILDCCFSGAFAEGVHAKDGGNLDLRRQLGGEGRAVMASSSSTQYSFDTSETGLSTYTQYLVQGIRSGEADLNHDGMITVDELHEFAKGHVQASRPAMSPQILPSREGYSIVISKAMRVDPRLAYAAKVREVADTSGVIPALGVNVLTIQRRQLGLAEADAQQIQDAELMPMRARAEARASLRKAVFKARSERQLEKQRPLLNELRVALGLSEYELRDLLEEPIETQRRKVRGWRYWPERGLLLSGIGIVSGAIVVYGYEAWSSREQAVQETTTAPAPAASALLEAKPEAAPPSRPRSISDDELDQVLRVDHSRTNHAIRISADNTLSEAREVARRVLNSSRLQPWIIHQDFGKRLYIVLVGGYSSERVAGDDRDYARTIVNQGAMVQEMATVCPRLTWNSGGYHDCGQSG